MVQLVGLSSLRERAVHISCDRQRSSCTTGLAIEFGIGLADFLGCRATCRKHVVATSASAVCLDSGDCVPAFVLHVQLWPQLQETNMVVEQLQLHLGHRPLEAQSAWRKAAGKACGRAYKGRWPPSLPRQCEHKASARVSSCVWGSDGELVPGTRC